MLECELGFPVQESCTLPLEHCCHMKKKKKEEENARDNWMQWRKESFEINIYVYK